MIDGRRSPVCVKQHYTCPEAQWTTAWLRIAAEPSFGPIQGVKDDSPARVPSLNNLWEGRWRDPSSPMTEKDDVSATGYCQSRRGGKPRSSSNGRDSGYLTSNSPSGTTGTIAGSC